MPRCRAGLAVAFFDLEVSTTPLLLIAPAAAFQWSFFNRALTHR
jgi:hypothetical protein